MAQSGPDPYCLAKTEIERKPKIPALIPLHSDREFGDGTDSMPSIWVVFHFQTLAEEL